MSVNWMGIRMTILSSLDIVGGRLKRESENRPEDSLLKILRTLMIHWRNATFLSHPRVLSIQKVGLRRSVIYLSSKGLSRRAPIQTHSRLSWPITPELQSPLLRI